MNEAFSLCIKKLNLASVLVPCVSRNGYDILLTSRPLFKTNRTLNRMRSATVHLSLRK